MNNRSVALDGWRGVAILCVLLGHFLPVRGINLGRAGVELFFALSGCLIGLVLFNQKMSLKEFGLRRFARIVPSMWLFLVIAVPVAYIRGENELLSVIYAFLGILNYSDSPIWRISHLWSIGIELQGYFLLAIISFICRRSGIRPHVLILFCICISWSIIAVTVPGKAINYYESFWRTEYRITAMLAAAGLISYTPQLLARRSAWIIFMVVGLLLQINPVPDPIKYTIGSALLALGCVQLWLTPLPPKWICSVPLQVFGKASFSIYLYQQLFYAEVVNIGASVALIASLLVGFTAHYLWDQPLHKAVNRRLLKYFAAKPSSQPA